MDEFDEERDFTAEFSVLIEELHTDEPKQFDAALDELRRCVDQFKPHILRALESVSNSHVRGGLLEALGDAGDPTFIPILAKELESDSCEVRFWAYVALQQVGTLDAHGILKKVDVRTWRIRP